MGQITIQMDGNYEKEAFKMEIASYPELIGKEAFMCIGFHTCKYPEP